MYQYSAYLFVEIIIKLTANIAISMPMIMLLVSASPKTNVPTRIAVMGSNTPSTDAFVAPILRVATASVEVDTMVGRIASHTKFNQSSLVSIPSVSFSPEAATLLKKKIAPTIST